MPREVMIVSQFKINDDWQPIRFDMVEYALEMGFEVRWIKTIKDIKTSGIPTVSEGSESGDLSK